MRKIKYVNITNELQSITLEVPWENDIEIIPPPGIKFRIKFFDTRSDKLVPMMHFVYKGTVDETELPLHRTQATFGMVCSTCDGGGCPDCTDPA